ncbi:MAG: tripartite tricarboxylate transporter substrate binding protein [Proteobacteria bacterium]|nr:tripartite tricarboxylate transporter substrate binding protein [Burkholderiales bacterium]
MIVPSGTGGGTDVMARIVAPKVGEIWGHPVIVDNRPGAASIVGVEIAARSAPDGYTIVMVSSGFAITPSLVRKLSYDTVRDFTPVVHVASVPNVLVVHPSMPARGLKELLALVRSRPGQLTYASAGIGSSPHLSMELLRGMAGLDLVHVPYKGSGPATIDVISGHVPMMLPSLPTVVGQIQAGRLRALAVTTTKRSSAIPNVPTIAELLPGYEAVQWFGILTPAGTPDTIVSEQNRAFNEALSAVEVRAALAAQGAEPVGGTALKFAQYIRVEQTRWASVVQKSGIAPE